jgi:alanine-synthesizing transaminase
MQEFSRIQRLPPYIFTIIDQLAKNLVAHGETVYDFGMGNPDLPTPEHIVAAMKAAMNAPGANRYSASSGIKALRQAIADWYGNRFNVDLDIEREVCVTLGSKEGISHLALATLGAGDVVLVPNPSYPIHTFGCVIAGADVRHVPMQSEAGFLKQLQRAIKESWPSPKMLIINFPSNPTARCVSLRFFSSIVDICRQHGIWILHDLAFADITFDGYKAPSILQVPGAKEIAVESYSLSMGYNMPGWRVGFMCGNVALIGALKRVKSYLDYGIFNPIQHAGVAALTGPQDCVKEIQQIYRDRRDFMCENLASIGWDVPKPKATLFLWAKIPEKFQHMGSLVFAKFLLERSHVAVSPGIAFGEYGNGFVRFSLTENEENMRAAITALKPVLS